MRRMMMIALFVAGCHTHEVARGGGGGSGASSPAAESAPKGKVVQSQRPVRTTPAGFLDAAAVRKIQAALGTHGRSVPETGKLDEATQVALKRFQAAQQQPATGYPDFDTLKRLGLDAQQIYLSRAQGQ